MIHVKPLLVILAMCAFIVVPSLALSACGKSNEPDPDKAIAARAATMAITDIYWSAVHGRDILGVQRATSHALVSVRHARETGAWSNDKARKELEEVAFVMRTFCSSCAEQLAAEAREG